MPRMQICRGIFLGVTLVCLFLGMNNSTASAQQGGGGFGGHGNYRPGNHHHYGNHGYRFSPYKNYNFNYGYYQRPYPYHLDYYRMRYQGSYEPYAGNLYGPPLIQQYVTPQYGMPQVTAPYFTSPYHPSPIRNYAGAYYW